ncbi:hypothetical protein NLV80_002714 [Acinetobacter baumannii]|uniref:hypothetical protein n=1 Tax=Acinetobacter pittii TaxID=48296 RepID=UPI0005C5997A|nr:hypothetical protein [Acinetobacter pittii]EKT9843584.1 hypothetical protein [Acinetobacter baumannii]EKT9847474.1 hypothetical protein [Acinetobacter baumannii]
MTTDIHTWRSEICQQLIRSGQNDIETVIKDASRLEVYVFGETNAADAKAESKNAEVKTSKTTKSQAAKDADAAAVEAEQKIAEAIAETAEELKAAKAEVVEETTKSEITKKEVNDICLALAKKDRSALLKILADVEAATVASIQESKYADVVEACEKAIAKFDAANA